VKAVITKNITGKLIARRDQFNARTIENTVGLTYHQQCWSVGLDYTKTYDDEKIMLKLSLAGLGGLGL